MSVAYAIFWIAAGGSVQSVSEAVPIGDPARWIRLSDWPSYGHLDRENWIVRFKLRVGRKGNVTACEIIETSGSLDMDGATCRALRRSARFNTHNDQVRFFVRKYQWRLPG